MPYDDRVILSHPGDLCPLQDHGGSGGQVEFQVLFESEGSFHCGAMNHGTVEPAKTSEFRLVRAEQGVVFSYIHSESVVGIGVNRM